MKRKQFLALFLSISVGLSPAAAIVQAEENSQSVEDLGKESEQEAPEILAETEEQTEEEQPLSDVQEPIQTEQQEAPQENEITESGSAEQGDVQEQTSGIREQEDPSGGSLQTEQENAVDNPEPDPQNPGQAADDSLQNQAEDPLEAAVKENFIRIVSAAAKFSDGEIQVELITENPDFDTLYFGRKEDEEKRSVYSGVKNEHGGYTFVFSVKEELLGKIIPYVPGKQSAEWYTDHDLYLKLPMDIQSTEAEKKAERTEAETEAVPQVYAEQETAVIEKPVDGSSLFLRSDDTGNSEEVLFLERAKAVQGAVDNATTLPDGEYTPEGYTFTGGTGKARLDCEKIVVSDGKATAVMTASSANMTHVYTGTAPSENETKDLYDPNTDSCGAGVYKITGKTVTIPVKLNQETALAARTTAMSSPHWVQYQYTITLTESVTPTEAPTPTDVPTPTEAPEQTPSPTPSATPAPTPVPSLEDGKIKLSVTNNTGMFKADAAYLNTQNGSTTLVMTMSGSGYHYMYKGTYEAAVSNGDKRSAWIQGKQNSDGKWVFTIPVSAGETYIPLVAISQSYLDKYDSGSDELQRAFFPRQLTFDAEKKTLVTDDYNETIQISVTSKVSDFKVEKKASMNVVGGPNSNNYACTPVLKMKDKTYDRVKYPTVLDGEISEKTASLSSGKTFTLSLMNAPGVTAFEDKKAFYVSFREKSTGKWVKYSITIDKLAKKITIKSAVKEDSGTNAENTDNGNTPGSDNDNGKANDSGKGNKGGGSTGGSSYTPTTGGSTGTVDSSTGLQDGDYTPDSFSWSGGTGKLGISCQKIRVSGGKAYATLVFSSGKIIYVKANGTQYKPAAQTENSSTFEIPVQLNANNKILACTTAMSQPHEVEYTVYVGLKAAKSAKLGDTSGISAVSGSGQSAAAVAGETEAGISQDGSGLTKLEDAPRVAGLEYIGTAENEFAKYFRLHYYNDGFTVLEISLSVEDQPDWTLREDDQGSGDPDVTADESDFAAEDAEDGGSIVEQKSLYADHVLQYLIVPEGSELPAGIGKEMILVQRPVERSYVDSSTVLKMLDKLQKTDRIVTVGISGQDCETDSVVRAMADGTIENIGHFDDRWFYRSLVLNKVKLAVLPAEILTKTDADMEGSLQADAEENSESLVQDIGDGLNLLKIPMLIDRADDEKEELAAYEWLKVYGVVFDCEKEAGEAFQAAENALNGGADRRNGDSKPDKGEKP